MIHINLLGKKKATKVPFELEEKLEKLGLSVNDLKNLRPSIFRVVFLAAGLYLANSLPEYLRKEKLQRLDAELQKLTAQSGQLQKELVSKKDIRKQMEQLNKEEGELQRQLNAVSALQQGRSLAFSTLNDVVSQLEKSKKVWLEDLKYEGKRIILNGKSWEYFPINDFVKSITESTRYSTVLFKEITTEASGQRIIPGVPEGTQKIKKFALEFNVKDGE
jgi:Tfp pilus assembly protein PilN